MMTKKEVNKRRSRASDCGKKQNHFYMITDGKFDEADSDGKVLKTYRSCRECQAILLWPNAVDP